MALRIEIGRMYNSKLQLRIGDVDGSSTNSNQTKEEVLADIAVEIDRLLRKSKEGEI